MLRLLSLCLILLPLSVQALTLGEARLVSETGENLRIEIPLSKTEPKVLNSLKVQLASERAYQAAGIPYGDIYKALRLKVKQRDGEHYYLEITSSRPISLPFLALLIQASWESGKITRTYSLIIDSTSLDVISRPRYEEKLVQLKEKQMSQIQQSEMAAPEPAMQSGEAAAESVVPEDQIESAEPEPLTPQAEATASTSPSGVASAPATATPAPSPPPPTPASVPEPSPPAPSAHLDSYYVELHADKELKMPGTPGELVVWIGDRAYRPERKTDKEYSDTTLPAIGQTAKVIPYAPMFRIEPTEYVCMKVHPTGSDATFKLEPLKTGNHEVGATVHLYESEDCSGAPVPKSVKKLKITVKVGAGEIIEGYGLQIWERLWKGFLDFWGWIVATFFALLIFLIRKRLQELFGFEPDK